MRLTPRLMLVAFLSLGFLGPNPFLPRGTVRHVSSCADPNQPAKSVGVASALPAGFLPWMQNAVATQSFDSFSAFRQQLAWQSAFLEPSLFSANSPFAPRFPSYAFPSIYDHAVSLARPDPVPQIWSGLMKDPQLQFLLVRNAAQPTVGATIVSSGSDGILGLSPLPKSNISKL